MRTRYNFFSLDRMRFMKLYKYMQKEHSESFFDTGKIRIGTLFDFRKTDVHNSVIGDENEGFQEKVMQTSGSFKFEEADTDQSSFLSNFFVRKPGSVGELTGVLEGNWSLVHRKSEPDYYVYCTSTSFNPRVMIEDFKYNSCIEIVKADLFINELFKAMKKHAKTGVYGNVSYSRKQLDFRDELKFPSVMIKDSKYYYQQEHRIAWLPKINSTNSIEPIFIQVPDARKFCKLKKLSGV